MGISKLRKWLGLNELKFHRERQCLEMSWWWPITFFSGTFLCPGHKLSNLGPFRGPTLWEIGQLLAVTQNWSDKMKTWGSPTQAANFPWRISLEFWCYTETWGSRPRTSRRRENVSVISQCFGTEDLPDGEIHFRYMAAHLQIVKLYELGG